MAELTSTHFGNAEAAAEFNNLVARVEALEEVNSRQLAKQAEADAKQAAADARAEQKAEAKAAAADEKK